MTIQATSSVDTYVIAHATDLRPDGGIAFAHGVAIAQGAQAKLLTYYAARGAAAPVRPMPDAADLLTHWKRDPHLEHVARKHTCCDDPIDTLMDAMRGQHHDLLIVGTHGHSTWEQVTKGSVSEALARNVEIPTLFVPIGGHGFVNEDTGEIGLRRVLVPAESEQAASRALEEVFKMLEHVHVEEVEITILKVGSGSPDSRPFPGLVVPMPRPKWTLTQMSRPGSASRVICEVADELEVNIIAMATRGHDTLWDVLRGSHTEQVVRGALCPVLSIPWES